MRSIIRLRCPGCNARIKAPIQLIGQSRACPGCGHEIAVRRNIPEDVGPVLMGGEGTALLPHRYDAARDGKLILIADDDLALNDGVRTALEKRGFNVIQASDGIQAKELLREAQPDLMILDLMMPHMGGYPVLEYLQGKSQAPPVIMITAQEGARHKAQAETLGVIDYIRKPFALGRLVESVEKGLGLRV